MPLRSLSIEETSLIVISFIHKFMAIPSFSSLKCQPSPPPNPRPLWVRGRRRLTFQTSPFRPFNFHNIKQRAPLIYGLIIPRFFLFVSREELLLCRHFENPHRTRPEVHLGLLAQYLHLKIPMPRYSTANWLIHGQPFLVAFFRCFCYSSSFVFLFS